MGHCLASGIIENDKESVDCLFSSDMFSGWEFEPSRVQILIQSIVIIWEASGR